MLTLVSVFTAQPLASRIGPRLRCRSFSQAMNIDGPEIASRMAEDAERDPGPEAEEAAQQPDAR
jgi:hypothetical protein